MEVRAQVRSPKGPEGGVCKVGLRLKAYPDNPIQCVASACQFKDGSGKIQCQNAQCACQQGACPGKRMWRLYRSRGLWMAAEKTCSDSCLLCCVEHCLLDACS